MHKAQAFDGNPTPRPRLISNAAQGWTHHIVVESKLSAGLINLEKKLLQHTEFQTLLRPKV